MALETKYLKVKKSLIKARTLAALDRGCSLTKSIFVNKACPTEIIDGEDHYVFQLELWRNSDFDKAVDQIRDKALLPESGVMPISGIGCDTYKKMVEEKIKLRLQFQDEFKSHVDGIIFCKKKLDKDLYSETVDERLPIQSILKTSPIVEQIKSSLDSVFSAPPTEFPALFVVLGSGFLVHKIYEDGKCEALSTSFVGGLTFISLAKLLLGTTNYNEVIELAEAGERMHTDSLIRDHIDVTQDNPYGGWNPDYPLLFFGNAALKDKSISEYKREDLARSLVAASVCVAVTIIGHLAKGERIKDILIGGSMAKSKLVRMEMYDAVKRDSFGSEYLNFRFMKFAHTSAFGALLRANPNNTNYYNN